MVNYLRTPFLTHRNACKSSRGKFASFCVADEFSDIHSHCQVHCVVDLRNRNPPCNSLDKSHSSEGDIQKVSRTYEMSTNSVEWCIGFYALTLPSSRSTLRDMSKNKSKARGRARTNLPIRGVWDYKSPSSFRASNDSPQPHTGLCMPFWYPVINPCMARNSTYRRPWNKYHM